VLAVQQPNLDWAYIEDWCARHGTQTKLAELRQAIAQL
jgi:hypothetical protein